MDAAGARVEQGQIKRLKPNNQPYKKKIFLLELSKFLNKKINNILSVKKLIKKKLSGGRLNELSAPIVNKRKISSINFFFNLINKFLNRFKNFLFLKENFYIILFLNMIKI